MNETAKICVNGWAKWLVGSLFAVVLAIGGYAYAFILPTIANNIIVNDRESRARDEKILMMAQENRVAITAIKAIQEDLREIKSILKRTAPSERR